GGYLPGYTPTFSRIFLEWIEAHRAAATARMLRVLVGRLAEARASGDLARAESTARACLGLDPLNEEATLVLAEQLALSGSKREAVGMLDRLMTDLGPPGAITLPATV